MVADGGDAVARVSLSLKRPREEDQEITSIPKNPVNQVEISGPPISSLNLRPAPSPARSTTSSSGLSDAPSSIAPASPAANAFVSLNSNAPPPPKKPKLTFQEKELEKQRKAQEKLEKDQAKARREAEKEELKRKTEAEREAKRIRLETEREEKRIAQDAEKATKLEKKKQQEAEKAAKEEEKRKSQRSQKTLNSFFKIPAKKDAHENNSTSSGQEQVSGKIVQSGIPQKKKDERSEYEKRFPDFFVHEHVTLAPILRWERDDTRLAHVQSTIDKVLESWDPNDAASKSNESTRPVFDPQEFFGLPSNDFRQRGRIPRPVRDIMAEMDRPSTASIDSQNTQIKLARNLLSKIPYKFLQFYEDVRPPYRGTFTRPLVPGTATRLARAPSRRELPEVNYDYDSEAEWVDEPGDDLGGEELDSENEDSDADEPDDMDGFLDNEGQDELENRHAMAMEPVSSGLCWENREALTLKNGQHNKPMWRYQMQVMHEDLNAVLPIDPFSTTKYWPEETHATSTAGLMNPPRLPLSISKSTNTPITGSALKSGENVNSKAASGTPAKGKKLISPSEMQRFRDLVVSKEHDGFSKIALIDVLHAKFNKKETKAAVKNTLEAIATHDKTGKWVLNDET